MELPQSKEGSQR